MPKRIIIIDDDRKLCELVSELLRGEGFEVDASGVYASRGSIPTTYTYLKQNRFLATRSTLGRAA